MGGQNTQKSVDVSRYHVIVQEERCPALLPFTMKAQDGDRASPELESNCIISSYLRFPAEEQR